MSIVQSKVVWSILRLSLVIMLALLNLPLDAIPVDARRSTLVIAIPMQINANNPCFLQPASAQCVAFIAGKRGVSSASARSLIERALLLYANEETPELAIYERSAVAVACLASRGSLKPGPDDDCAACGIACENENRKEVCELFCTVGDEAGISTRTTTAALNVLTSIIKVQTSIISQSNTRFVEPSGENDILIFGEKGLLFGGIIFICVVLVLLILIGNQKAVLARLRYKCGMFISFT